MAYSDFLLSIQKQLACLCARTDPDGAALPDLAVTWGSDPVTVADVEKVAGVAPQLDDTDKIAVSLYGKASAAGDTAVLLNSDGRVGTQMGGGVTEADGVAETGFVRPADSAGNSRKLEAPGLLYNGTTWDRARGNIEETLLASTARTSTTSSADQTNYNGRGIYVILNVTAVPGGDTITLAVEAKDPVSGTYDALLDDSARSGTGLYSFMVYPGAADSDSKLHGVTALALPRTWRVTITHSGAGSFTYSVAYALIV